MIRRLVGGILSGRRTASVSSFWLLANRVVAMACGLATSVLLARHLSMEEFGIISITQVVAALIGPLLSAGLGGLAVKEIANSADVGLSLGTIFAIKWVGAVLAVGAGITVMALASPGSAWGIWLSAAMGLAAFSQVFVGCEFYFQTRQEVGRFIPWQIATALAFLLAKAVLCALHMPVGIIFSALIAEAVTLHLAPFAVYAAGRHGGPAGWRFSGSLAWGLLAKSFPLIISGLAAYLYLKIDQVMIARLLGESQVAVYAVAARISEVWYFIPTSFSVALLPVMVELQRRDPAAIAPLMLVQYRRMFLLGAAIASAICLAAPWGIPWLYGDSYAGSVPVLMVHIWACPFVFMRAMFSKWIILTGDTWFSLATHLAGAVVNVALNLWLIPRFGVVGAAWATLFSYMAASFLSLFLHRDTREQAKLMLRAMLTFPRPGRHP